MAVELNLDALSYVEEPNLYEFSTRTARWQVSAVI